MSRYWSLVCAVTVYLSSFGIASAACDANVWREYAGIKLWKFAGSDAYFYATPQMDIDADGAPNAYHPKDIGIDALGNAGFPNGGWKNVLVVDPDDPSRPFVQTSGDFAGYFVSKTSLQDKTLPATDPSRYVDARVVSYIVFPGAFFAIKGTGDYGDFAVVRNLSNDKQNSAIVADGGPQNAPLGEVSVGLAESLGGSHVNPRNGAGKPRGTFVYLIFPKSKANPAWPIAQGQMDQQAGNRLAALGGWER